MISRKVLFIAVLFIVSIQTYADPLLPDRRGRLEGVTDTGIVWGWAANKTDPSERVVLYVQIDNEYPFETVAREVSDYIRTAPTPGNYGFIFYIPPQYINHATRTIRAWPRYGGGPFLENSPITVDLKPLPPRPSFGALEGFNQSTEKLFGWLIDPNAPLNDFTSNRIILIFDGELGSGLFFGTTGDYINRPDIVELTRLPGHHGFEFAVPDELFDGQYHTVRMYAEEGGMNIIQIDPPPGSPPQSFIFGSNTPLQKAK